LLLVGVNGFVTGGCEWICYWWVWTDLLLVGVNGFVTGGCERICYWWVWRDLWQNFPHLLSNCGEIRTQCSHKAGRKLHVSWQPLRLMPHFT